jgi:hypothetical protein
MLVHIGQGVAAGFTGNSRVCFGAYERASRSRRSLKPLCGVESLVSAYQLRSATAAVDKLMGNLLGGSTSLGGIADGDEDYDDDRGPTADLILGM